MGNKADVSGNDLAEYWEEDPHTRVICMYLESFGNPRKFTEIAKRVSLSQATVTSIMGRLEAKGLRAGKDFFLAFSPERVDPGNQTYGTHNTPKVVGGTTDRCTEMATLLYRQGIEHVHPVSSTQTAERSAIV